MPTIGMAKVPHGGGIRCAYCHNRRLLRPLFGPHRRDQASVRIIEQLIDTIPGGSVNASPEGKGTLPEKGQVYGSIEATIQQFELVMHNRGFDAPIGEAYGSIEGPNGELGYYLVGDGDRTPWRVSVRPLASSTSRPLPRCWKDTNWPISWRCWAH